MMLMIIIDLNLNRILKPKEHTTITSSLIRYKNYRAANIPKIYDRTFSEIN